jgi:zinc-ribbon domain
MKVAEIEIHAGGVDRPYKTVGEISAKVQAATAFSKTPTLEDINLKLQEKALQMGANAVINVKYDRGMSLTSYKVLRANGVAVVLESDEIKCPYCAELVKREAVKCKHCGSDLNARITASQ